MYKETIDFKGNKGICRLNGNDTITFIPFAPDNTDYQAYLKWVEAGNTPEPADE